MGWEMELRTYKSFSAGYAMGMWCSVGLYFLYPFGVNPIKAQILAGFFASVFLGVQEWKVRRLAKWVEAEYARRGYPPPPPLKETDV